MLTLYHVWLSPFCRKVRIVLAEKNIAFDTKVEQVWDRRRDFLAMNPAGDVPVIVEPDGSVLADSAAICEYLEETHPEPALLGGFAHQRAEVRRLVAWFDRKFDREVTDKLLTEKIMKRFLGMGAPDSKAIRAAQSNIHVHLDYIAYLTERRHWLAGESMTLADIAAAAHLSAVDYLGNVPWQEHRGAKEWYARIKSRPSFRAVLADAMPGIPPPKHYADLDF
jgi:glutathione S-transferase